MIDIINVYYFDFMCMFNNVLECLIKLVFIIKERRPVL